MMDETWLTDAEIERQREARKEREALHLAKLRNAVRMIAKQPDGCYFLRWLVHGTGVFDSTGFPFGHAEAAFVEGKRAVGLSVLQLCAAVGVGAAILNDQEVTNE